MQIARINNTGRTQIADALGLHHKLGRDHFTSAMISALAGEAEDHYADGNGCYIEIRATDSVTGSPVVVDISADGYDLEPLADE